MKVVFLIPSYNRVCLLTKTLQYLEDLNPQPYKYIFLENNSEDDTLKVLVEWGKNHPTEIIRLWFAENTYQILGTKYGAIGHVRQILLDRARKMDVDYVIFMDSDIIIPYTDFITQITSWKKDLIGVPWPMFRRNHGLCLSPIWINHGLDRETKPQIVKTVCSGFEEVYGVAGAGTCISRKLLMDKRVNFLPLIDSPQVFSEDIGYCVTARKHGYKCYVDGSLLLGHYVEVGRKRVWHDDFKFGGVQEEKGVVLMPEDYITTLLEIDRLMVKNV